MGSRPLVGMTSGENMFKIEGLDKLQKELDEVSKSLNALSGQVSSLQFDPGNEASVAAAVRKMEASVDAKVARYRNNPFVKELTADIKKQYREEILKQAREAKSAK